MGNSHFFSKKETIMQNRKSMILRAAEETERRVAKNAEALSQTAKLTDYIDEVYTVLRGGTTFSVWTRALQRALDENEVVEIPASEIPYDLDGSVMIGSNSKIVAYGATVRLLPDVNVLMLRNQNVKDGTHVQTIMGKDTDENIAIFGGTWEESREFRLGYGRSGMFDENRSMYGVSTCMLFSNVKNLFLKDLTFRHTAGFSVQIGNAKDIVVHDIYFNRCFADGIHVNGNTEDIAVRNLSGFVGDDLIALNMYDWQDSSINFGPLKNAFVEGIEIDPNGCIKDIRILPGIYRFDNGETVDCSLENVLIRKVHGVQCFKLYYQTPAYNVGEEPEWGAPGSGDHIYFEDIDVISRHDNMKSYKENNPITGRFGAWEVCSNIGLLHLENIRIVRNTERFPLGKPVSVGPKSVNVNGREVFDPYASCVLKHLVMKNVTVNGNPVLTAEEAAHEIVFDHIYDAPNTSGKGELLAFTLEE